MRIVARAPAKLVLLGEYAVLEGAPAIVAAVDRLVTVTLEPEPAEGLRAAGDPGPWCVRSDLGGGVEADIAFDDAGAIVAGADWLRGVESVLTRAAALLSTDDAPVPPARLPGGTITIASASLYVDAGETKLGLGSSAAVLTALQAAVLDALAGWGLVDLPPESRTPSVSTVRAAQPASQAGGSGVDVAASVAGGVLRYQLTPDGPAVEPLPLPPGVGFAVVWTGASASTPAFLEGVRRYAQAQPEAYAQDMDAMRGYAQRAVTACTEGAADAFLAAVRAYHAAMEALGRHADLPIVSAAHQAIADLAASEGVAYKPSGAGGGDVGLLFASSQPALVQAGRLAERAGYRLLDLEVHPMGVTVERHERTAS